MEATEGRDENGKLIRIQLGLPELETIYVQYMLTHTVDPHEFLI
jgi:hypothetical protein